MQQYILSSKLQLVLSLHTFGHSQYKKYSKKLVKNNDNKILSIILLYKAIHSKLKIKA